MSEYCDQVMEFLWRPGVNPMDAGEDFPPISRPRVWHSTCFMIDKILENGTDNEEHDEANLDDNKNKILRELSPTDSSYHSDKDDVDAGEYDGNGDSEVDTPTATDKPTSVTEKKEQTTEEKVSAILKEIQSAAPDTTSEPVHYKQKPRHAEDPKIAELLSRRDTAVIYPEPVSDGEDQQNGDGGSSEHEEEIILKCMHCPQTFLRAIVLRDHMREKHSDKPLKFMCPKCDETFHQKSQLDKHLTLHSPTSQICTVCNKTFANVYRLQRHMISHNESTDLRKFKCPECGKAFKFKHHLKEHVRIHSGEKPFVCNNCGKRFSHSGSFSSHTTSKKCWGLSSQKGRVGPQDGIQNLAQNTAGQGVTNFGHKIPVTFANAKSPQYQRTPLQSVPVTLAHQQHFLPNPYSQQKGIPSFYYPPQVFASPDGFLHPVFSVSQSMPHLPHSLALSHLQRMKQGSSEDKERSPSVSSITSSARSARSVSPHSQSTRSFSPHSYSGRSISPQSSSAYSLPSPHHYHGHRGSTPSSVIKEMTPVQDRAKDTSPAVDTEQISPDVNSNTKLLMIKEEPNSTTDDMEDDADKEPDTSDPEPDSSVKNEDLEDEEKDDDRNETRGGKRICQYCDEIFNSPVAHYQHERYMCKLNKDLVQRAPTETCQSPHSTVSDTSHIESTPNGSTGHHSDEEEVEELYKDSDSSFDEKKMRIRSLFTEEQQNYLKSQYMVNPRPRKYELIRIGNKIGFPKRVVQVWFQNMRARERKQGRDGVVGLAAMRSDRDISAKSPTYIPNVPKLSTVLSLSSHKNTAHLFGPSSQPRYNSGEAPLDLTMCRTPPLAHGGNLSRLSTPDSTHEDQVLNLSVKKDSSVEREKSREKSVPRESEKSGNIGPKSMQDSAIFKYMQQEGMILHKTFQDPSASVALTLAHSIQNQFMQQSVASIVKAPLVPVSHSQEMKSSSSIQCDPNYDISQSKADSLVCPRLVIDETTSESSSSVKDTVTYSAGLPIAVASSQSSGLILASPPLHEDTHNLTTLAEAAQRAANILSHKPKRLRKKTWRQMESEEVQMELDDSISTDDDQPLKKKRRSWKNHRVDRDEGMYACDQCNKVFSKQSSLARHKYEHSGARPFACDMCSKSFKHKHHLTEHKRLHSGEKPFQCKKCGKRFSHSGSFSQHMNHRYNYCSPHKMSDCDGDGEELSSQESP